MTTQTVSVTLIGSGDNIGMTATCTDDGFTELKDSIGTLSLYRQAKGKTFHSFTGRYAAGGASFRIRNTVTNKIKTMEFLALNGNPQRAFARPITIEDNDIIEAMAEAVPT
jgi:hypothetical protein